MDVSSLYCPMCGALNAATAQTCLACGKPLSEASPQTPEPPARTSSGQLPSQHLLQGRFRILKRIGVGGFGAVYQGEDTEARNRLVAIKEMQPAGLSPRDLEEATETFHREAQLLRELQHPSLPRIYAHFNEGDHWYLVMDFIGGETLEKYLARQGGRLPLKEVFALGIQLCKVLEYLHTCHPPVIFRDLKPANVMLTQDQQVYLIDFGIARHFTPGKQHDTVAFGSPGYAAPEQYGKAQTTPRSDIFSLGALLHHLLTGTDPSEQPMRFAPILAPVPAGLAWLIEQMVDLDVSGRPGSAAFIEGALKHLRETWQDPQAQARTASSAAAALVSTLPPPQPRNKRGWYISGAVVMVMLAIIGACFAVQAATPAGISNVQIGPGDTSGTIQYESTTFFTDEQLVCTFTATTHDTNSEVELQYFDQNNIRPSDSFTISLQTGTHDYYFVLQLLASGTFTVELQYNHVTEYTNTVTVGP